MKLKKILSVLLVLCLAIGMLTACGDKDDDKGRKTNKETDAPIVKGDLKSMLEAIRGTESGVLYVEQNFSGKTSSEAASGKTVTEIRFDRKAGEYAVRTTIDTVAGEIKLTSSCDVLVIKDDKLYFNLESIGQLAASAVSPDADEAAEYEEFIKSIKGWFVLPLPKGWETMADRLCDEATSAELLDTIVSSVKAEGQDGDYTVALKTKADYKVVLDKLNTFINNNGKKFSQNLMDFLRNLGGIDINAYVSELLDFYEGDVKAIAGEYGAEFGITEDQVKALLAEAKQQDYKALWDQLFSRNGNLNLDDPALIDQLVGTINQAFAEIVKGLDSADDAKMPEISARVTAGDDNYSVQLKISNLDGITADASYKLTPGSVTVTAPTETTGLKPIVDLLVPSYLRYVNKSRAASDVMAFSDCMQAAERVAVDPQFDLPAGTMFTITLRNGEIKLTVYGDTDNSADAQDEWRFICDADDFTPHDQSLKKANGALIGTLQSDGSLTWKVSEADAAMREFFANSNLLTKFDIGQ